MHTLENLDLYRLSIDIGETIWKLVIEWDYFQKSTLGNQLVRAADSISLNIAEGYGRQHHKELKQFCFISRGSVLETKSCLEKAFRRNLIDNAQYEILLNESNRILMMLNKFIRSIENKNFL
jgi:four helix bundle protein